MTQKEFNKLQCGKIIKHADGRLGIFIQPLLFKDTALVEDQSTRVMQLWTAKECNHV